ncbi:MAG: hypothetical protein K0S61_1742, partial [Anaerocolumna sp.]|nr:hypothetical protein [Anaerocolumna sp.]
TGNKKLPPIEKCTSLTQARSAAFFDFLLSSLTTKSGGFNKKESERLINSSLENLRD